MQGEIYREEAEKLADVVQHIAARRASLDSQMPAFAPHRQTAQALQKILEANADSLESASQQPYFGRLDYLRRDADGLTVESVGSDAGGDPAPLRTVYLGIAFIRGTDVISWTAPIGKLWYSQSFEDGYTSPSGQIQTRVDLKRYIRIRNQKLEGVNDVFRRHSPELSSTRSKILEEAVSRVGGVDGHLQVIVETIEPDQYESIANVSDKVLIVQGAAGSGKSEIGLHRIAYLLSPFNDLPDGERPTPDTTLFVGPSKAFLEYASDVLPSLGVRDDVAQVRFSQWINGIQSMRIRVRARIWSNMMQSGDMTRFNLASEAFKGSFAMADAIDRHIAQVVQSVTRKCQTLSEVIPGVRPKNELTRSQIRSFLGEAFSNFRSSRFHLNNQRREFIRRVTGFVELAERRRNQIGQDEWERNQSDVWSAVEDWCDEAWKHMGFNEMYNDLLSDVDRMARLSGANVPRETLVGLAESVDGIQKHGYDDSDIGALAYIDHRLNGTIRRQYRHIVVDEAQDMSPIEFKLLASSSTNNWFTILGDTAQRLTPYRGIKGWREIERVFGRSEIEIQRARRSYRSTRQITEFNNRILRTFDKNIAAPIPFKREGHRVEFNRYRNAAFMFQGIIDDVKRIRSMEGLEDAIVAVLVRDQLNLNRFVQFCADRSFNEISRVGDEGPGESRTVLARIPDVKGLEFDAVLVMGVNDSFRDTIFNKKLLYMATTRAKHYLGIHWFGQQSSILGSVSSRGVTQYR